MKIKLILDRFEGEKAVLKTEDKQSIVWPKNSLPEASYEGMVLIFNICDAKDEVLIREKQAKDILNEILNTD